MYKVKYFNPVAQEAIDTLEKYDIKRTEEEKAEVYVVRSNKLHDNKDILEGECVARAGIGTGNVPEKKLTEHLVPLFYAPGGNSVSVMESTILKVLSAAKNFTKAIDYVNKSDMEPIGFEKVKKQFKGQELKGKTILVIGLGMIGAKVANSCANMGMRVIGKDIKIDMDFLKAVLGRHSVGQEWLESIDKKDGRVVVSKEVKEVAEGNVLITDNWMDAIKVADFVTIHCGYWGKPVFDADFYKNCKKGINVINLDRGQLIDEAETLKALKEGTLRSYQTDFAPANMELRTHKNVDATPHIAATTADAQKTCGVMVVDEILSYMYDGNVINSKNFPNICMCRKGAFRITLASKTEVDVTKVEAVFAKKNMKLLQKGSQTTRGKDVFYYIFDFEKEIKEEELAELKAFGKIRFYPLNAKYEEKKKSCCCKGKKKEEKKEVYNFFAGPSVMDPTVLEELMAKMKNWDGIGVPLIAMSHRSKICVDLFKETEELFKELLKIPDNYRVLFIQGGATLQFSMIPMNLTKKGEKYGIINSGTWTNKAVLDAKMCEKMGYGTPVILGDEKKAGYKKIPVPTEIPQDLKYFYYCWNETIHGLEWQHIPDSGKVPLVIDASSNFCSRPIDWKNKNIGIVYGGAQKNCGMPGIAVVIIRDDLINKDVDLPIYLKYSNHASKDSAYNTPPVLTVQSINLTLKWIKRQGGVEELEKVNIKKADLLYNLMDNSEGFYIPRAGKGHRSRMNVSFNLKTTELEKKFLAEANEMGMLGLKGHRSLGGARASIYNMCPFDHVVKLVEFMKKFMNENK